MKSDEIDKEPGMHFTRQDQKVPLPGLNSGSVVREE